MESKRKRERERKRPGQTLAERIICAASPGDFTALDIWDEIIIETKTIY